MFLHLDIFHAYKIEETKTYKVLTIRLISVRLFYEPLSCLPAKQIYRMTLRTTLRELALSSRRRASEATHTRLGLRTKLRKLSRGSKRRHSTATRGKGKMKQGEDGSQEEPHHIRMSSAPAVLLWPPEVSASSHSAKVKGKYKRPSDLGSAIATRDLRTSDMKGKRPSNPGPTMTTKHPPPNRVKDKDSGATARPRQSIDVKGKGTSNLRSTMRIKYPQTSRVKDEDSGAATRPRQSSDVKGRRQPRATAAMMPLHRRPKSYYQIPHDKRQSTVSPSNFLFRGLPGEQEPVSNRGAYGGTCPWLITPRAPSPRPSLDNMPAYNSPSDAIQQPMGYGYLTYGGSLQYDYSMPNGKSR